MQEEGGQWIKRGCCRVTGCTTCRSGSGRRMSRTLLWLMAAMAFASLTSLADALLLVMSAPNLLRVGAKENIFVECQDCRDGQMSVRIDVMKYPNKIARLATTALTLTRENDFQGLGEITIPVDGFSKHPNVKQYVYLQAEFEGEQLLERIVLVSFQSGYIFIQTDKTIYTPDSKVRYRMFALTPGMEPIERDNTTSIAIDIETPEGIIFPQGPVVLKSGILSGEYQLTELVSPGLWKVVARFHSNQNQSYFAEFEVKEYVLPSLEVKLTSRSPFFYVDSEELTVDIRATYLFGEEVDGTAYVVFGVIKDGQKRGFPKSLKSVQIESGHGDVTLEREHIMDIFPEIEKLVGSSIYVAVNVLTEDGGEMVEAELRNIQIVTTPYTIDFKKTPKYYKPGMSFDVTVEVFNPDGTPAEGITVVVGAEEVKILTSPRGMARVSINTQTDTSNLIIPVKTDDPLLSPERQASAEMVALPYNSNSGSYLHIDVSTAELKLGDNLKISLIPSKKEDEQNDITYLILSRGQLLKFGRYQTASQKVIALPVPITKEMLPSFRIIAYYFTNNNEVVSDSVWVDVEDSCMGSLKLEPLRQVPSYEPRKMFGFKVTGDPGATVGLVAVDKGVYVLNNKLRLTQKKVWDIVEKSDTGCTPGGGKDGMSVFYDAGLLFHSNIVDEARYRQELKCETSSRRKRAAPLMNVITGLASKYKTQLERECCREGMAETPLSYTCERRSEYIEDGAECVRAFLHCCREMQSLRAERREDSHPLARTLVEDNIDPTYQDMNEVTSRTKFPESWLWLEVKLQPCASRERNCDTKSATKLVPLQDSITTWQLTGISLSRTHGICVAEPLEIIVRKDFFIDLRLPYSAVQGEQIEIKAILHNYSPDVLTVRVDLLEEEHVCSSASKRHKYRQEVKVGMQTTRSVPFVIIPMKEGERRIEVKATVKDSSLNDGIKKMLRVVPAGVLVKAPHTVSLDPAKKGVGGIQREFVSNEIPQANVAPKTPTNTEIFLSGREQISELLTHAISGESMGNLIQEPWGCGEQNMAAMTLPVIATRYLDATNQWEVLGFEKRSKALQYIKTGYENQLVYRKSDGSFAVFEDSQSSTWLTAYVVKVFAMASDLVAVPSSIICWAVKYLILEAQQPDGMFKEEGYVYDYAMRGDVDGIDSDASMTAFCLIAMQESRPLCASPSLDHSIDKAVKYLEKRLPELTYSYAVAMTSYALAIEKKFNRDILYNFVSQDQTHWPVPRGPSYTLEATAYALLALVKARAFEDARPVVRWFNQQQKVGGGYGPTQSTIMVYQAVAEYWANAEEPQYDLKVDLSLPDRTKLERFNFNHGNHYATRTARMKGINRNFTVTAAGTGEATLKVVSLYYALPEKGESKCEKFNLSVQLIPEKLSPEGNIYKLKIEVMFKDQERNATMSIVDVGLLTGFTYNKDDLDTLSKGHARTISKYEMNEVLSARGSLIIYLPKVSNTQPEEISFRIHQKFRAEVLQPAAVTVYEYYKKKPCVKFYRPQRRAGEILRLCRNNECSCAEENCSMQNKNKISNADRIAKSCESTPTSKIDFVYKVSVENYTEGLSTDIYTMRILQTIKEGNYDVGTLDGLRYFLGFSHCSHFLNLKIGRTYLIMGTSGDIRKDEQNQSFEYVLGERTWVEYWPTDIQCQTEEYSPTCKGLEQLIYTYVNYGCPRK